MSIWHPAFDHNDPKLLLQLNKLTADTADQRLGLEFTEIGADYLRGTVPVDERTRQPLGLLHGGVSAVLAESLGSLAANLCVDPEKSRCVGLEINANHLRAVREGVVTGTAKPFRLGRSTQVWGIELQDHQQRLTCVARLTVAVVAKEF